MHFERLNATLTGNEASWTSVGVPKWKQNHEGIIYPPVWSYDSFDPDPTRIPNLYAHELGREDFALLTSRPLADTDISVDYKCPCGSVIHGGIVFRALDSARFYVVDIGDLGCKGHYYELALWRQDGTGYRRELGRGRAPHSVVPESIAQGGITTREEWDNSSPDWVTIRVQASGSFIRVSMDGQIVLETRDRAYLVGCVGLVARGSVYFRNLRVEGVPGQLPGPWTTHEGELPRFFYPGGEHEGWNAYPSACRTLDGVTLVAWWHAPLTDEGHANTFPVLTRSEDEGKTWSPLRPLFDREGYNCSCDSLFAHADATVSAVVSMRLAADGWEKALPQSFVIRSSDRGESWSEPEGFTIAGRPMTDYWDRHPRMGMYSPMTRLSDGTVIMCGYEAGTVPGGSEGTNAERLDRSLLFRSMDDGRTWEEPTFFDESNFDHNECMAVEVEPGRLVAFMRTLRAPRMWTSTSDDGGKSWTPLVQSNVNATCPILIRHSSGALILGSRGMGTFLRLSYDQGHTWSESFRMSPAGAMMAMVEMGDGRVLNIMHEGYRTPSYIRGQFFRVTPDGPQAAE